MSQSRTYTQSGPVSVDADLLWSAAIKDETGSFFRDFDKNVDQLTNRTKQSFNEVDAGSKKSAQSIGLIAGAVSALTMQLLNLGIAAVRQFTQLAKTSVGVAARAQTLAVALRTVGGNAGYSAEELAGFEERMKANGITTIKTREALLKMAQANLDLSKSSDLARVAQDAAVIAGTNSSQAFSRMIHGITTLNPLILRNLGIVVNAQLEYKKWADANNTTAQAMDFNTKQQILLNAVMAAGEKISGTYTAAMGTAGKQSASLARHQEEVLLAMGKVAQPLYLEWIQFMTRELKEMREWLAENKDELEHFANMLGFAAGKALELLSALIRMGKEAPNLIRKIPIFLLLEGLDDIDERWEGLGTSARQFFSLVAAGWAGITTLVVDYVGALTNVVKMVEQVVRASEALKRGDIAGAQEAATQALLRFNEAVDQAGGAWERAQGVAAEVLLEWSHGLGVLKEEADDAADALDNLGDNMEAIADEVEGVVSAIAELNAKVGKDLAELAKRRARQDIDTAIREARRREDLARRHQERILDLERDYAKRRQETIDELAEDERDMAEAHARDRFEAERDHARDLLDVEIDYRRRLDDIQRNFDEDASEAARRNDAVALARLIRQNKRNLVEAKVGRDRNVEDAQRDYGRELNDLKEAQELQREELKEAAQDRLNDLYDDIATRFRAAEDARQKDLEGLARSLAREKADRTRQRMWEEQDRRDKYAAEATALGVHLSEMEYIDELSMRNLILQHGQYIADDLALWEAYYKSRNAIQARTSYSKLTEKERYDIEELGYDPSEWGFARGGMGIAMGPQTVRVGEDEPEVVAALPLSRISTHNLNFSDWDVNVNGVSPQTEAQLVPLMTNMMSQLAIMLRSAILGGNVGL